MSVSRSDKHLFAEVAPFILSVPVPEYFGISIGAITLGLVFLINVAPQPPMRPEDPCRSSVSACDGVWGACGFCVIGASDPLMFVLLEGRKKEANESTA